MAGGEKKVSDISSRLKRPGKLASRSSKSTSSSSSPISTPAKAAIATPKSKKDDLHRRKHGLNELLLRSSPNESSTSSHPDDNDTSDLSIGGVPEARTGDHIAELEKTLAIARAEQEAMRAELERARQHEMLFEDTVQQYKQQLAEVHNKTQGPSNGVSYEFEEESGRERSWSKEREELLDEIYELRGRVADVRGHSRSEQHHIRREAEWAELTMRLHNSEKEAEERSRQLLDLKQSISALTRTENQATDHELAEHMSQLYHRIREWVITNYRRSKLNFTNLSSKVANLLYAIYPDYATCASIEKIPLYQAIVAYHLQQLFATPFCLGLPYSGTLSPLRDLANQFQASSPSDYHDWRCSTIRLLKTSSPAREILHQGEINFLESLAVSISSTLSEICGISANETSASALLSILHSAAELYSLLASQKAMYDVFFIKDDGEGDHCMFDAERMESVCDEGDEEDAASERRFLFSVFVGLEKRGDELGGNLGVRNVIVRGRACCGVG